MVSSRLLQEGADGHATQGSAAASLLHVNDINGGTITHPPPQQDNAFLALDAPPLVLSNNPSTPHIASAMTISDTHDVERPHRCKRKRASTSRARQPTVSDKIISFIDAHDQYQNASSTVPTAPFTTTFNHNGGSTSMVPSKKGKSNWSKVASNIRKVVQSLQHDHRMSLQGNSNEDDAEPAASPKECNVCPKGSHEEAKVVTECGHYLCLACMNAWNKETAPPAQGNGRSGRRGRSSQRNIKKACPVCSTMLGFEQIKWKLQKSALKERAEAVTFENGARDLLLQRAALPVALELAEAAGEALPFPLPLPSAAQQEDQF